MTTFAEATTAQTEQAIYLGLLADMEGLLVNVAGFGPFSTNQAMPRLLSKALAAEQALRVKLVNAGFLDRAALAGDDFLDALALGWFNETRIPALAAVWDLAITGAPGAIGYTIGRSSKELTAQGQDGGLGAPLYQNTNADLVTLVAGAATLCRFTCLTAGTIGNQLSGGIAEFVVGKPGYTVTNAAPGGLVTAGREKEGNAAFVLRLKGKWSVLAAGWTRASFAYRLGISAPSITRSKLLDAGPYGPGTVGAILASPAGAATATELAAVAADFGADDVKALGSSGFTPSAASLYTVVVSGTLTCSAPTLLLAKAALAQLERVYPIGAIDGELDLALVLGILVGGAYPEWGIAGFPGVSDSAITAPLVDTTGIGSDAIIAFETSGLSAI